MPSTTYHTPACCTWMGCACTVQVKSYDAPTFFTFHIANGFEADGSLHVDFGGYEDAKVGGGGLVIICRALLHFVAGAVVEIQAR